MKVALDAPVSVFKPEMLVNVTYLAPKPAEGVMESAAPMRLYVPKQLVLHDDAGTYVWLADQSAGVARRAAVATSPAPAASLVEVTAGLTVASRIIARGYESLADGRKIRVLGEEANVASADTPSAATTPSPRHTLDRLPHGD